MEKSDRNIIIIGAGLAGTEAAFFLAKNGFEVTLIDSKPEEFSPAHTDKNLGELVCSNSLRSTKLTTGAGLLKKEMEVYGSLILKVAFENSVPSGESLSVDRRGFARKITDVILGHENIRFYTRRVDSLEDFLKTGAKVIVATGPLSVGGLVNWIARHTGSENLFFYDAIAPIVEADSIDFSKTFFANRYGKDESGGDFLNIPMSYEEYKRFYDALVKADTVTRREFESEEYFEGCQPIERIAQKGENSLAFGPMRPVGFKLPEKFKHKNFAVVQLRAENRSRTAYNLVGFQTRLTYPDQKRVFSLIPGLENAKFLRFGSIHRNTFFNYPEIAGTDLVLKKIPDVRLAGQITGVEGYIESTVSGFLSALFLIGEIKGVKIPVLPDDTATGALYHHITTPKKHFQPTNINFGIINFTPPKKRMSRLKKRLLLAKNAITKFEEWFFEVKKLLNLQ